MDRLLRPLAASPLVIYSIEIRHALNAQRYIDKQPGRPQAREESDAVENRSYLAAHAATEAATTGERREATDDKEEAG
jgi:hypothetical protein